jgi:hypothetical protein
MNVRRGTSKGQTRDARPKDKERQKMTWDRHFKRAQYNW